MSLFDAICPLDGRYIGAEEETYREAEPYLSQNAEIRYLLKVECAILRTYGSMGLLPEGDLSVLDGLEESILPEEVYAEEEKTQHNIRALVNCIQKRLPAPLKPFVHLGPTSADITDTARALQLRDFVLHVVLRRLIALERALIAITQNHAATPQVGRTHGQHAVPTTFGHAVALYVSRLGGRILVLEEAARKLVGKLAGAVGAYNSFSILCPDRPRELEQRVMEALGLHTSPTAISSQIVEPETVTDLACAAVSAFSVIANLADDLRHLMRTEIGEIKKITHKGHVGSSTMPHKVNPKDFENVKSLWKAFMPRVITVFSDQLSEHQRDLTNSASGRFFLELLGGFYYAVVRMQRAVQKIEIDSASMARNLAFSRETYVAEPLYIVCGMSGVPNAYDIVKGLSEKARERGTTLSDLVDSEGWPDELADNLEDGILTRLEEILRSPETYRGLAEEVARETHEYWADQVDALELRLARAGAEADVKEGAGA